MIDFWKELSVGSTKENFLVNLLVFSAFKEKISRCFLKRYLKGTRSFLRSVLCSVFFVF